VACQHDPKRDAAVKRLIARARSGTQRLPVTHASLEELILCNAERPHLRYHGGSARHGQKGVGIVGSSRIGMAQDLNLGGLTRRGGSFKQSFQMRNHLFQAI
jgi:hypothetical protein